MAPHRLPVVVAAVGVAAAWGAARYAAFAPMAWLAILIAVGVLAPRERRLFGRHWLLAGLLLLASSWLVAADHETALRLTLVLVLAALLFGLARLAPPDDRLVAVVALGIALTAAVALLQAFGGLARARELVTDLPEGWREAAAARLSGGRVFGTSALPGHYAAMLLLATPLVVERLWRGVGWRRVVWFTALAGSLTAIVLTRSLAAMGVAAVLLVAAAGRRLRGRLVLVAGTVLVMLAAVVVALRHDLATLEPIRLRWLNWTTTMWVFGQHPWLGVGLGGVGQAGLVAPTAAGNFTPYAHNTYLQLLAEFGLAGAGALAVGLWALVRLVRRGFPGHTGLALAVAAVPIHNLVDFSAYAPEVLLPWAVLAGTLAGRTRPLPDRPARGHAALALALCGLVLAALSWRSETELASVGGAPPAVGVERAMAAARWAPWEVNPVELAGGLALESGAPAAILAEVDGQLAARSWVRPRSASWAESRSRLLLAQGRAGEALVWAREGHRRAPWRQSLIDLEAMCSRAR
jgi:O-antigen ligase